MPEHSLTRGYSHPRVARSLTVRTLAASRHSSGRAPSRPWTDAAVIITHGRSASHHIDGKVPDNGPRLHFGVIPVAALTDWESMTVPVGAGLRPRSWPAGRSRM